MPKNRRHPYRPRVCPVHGERVRSCPVDRSREYDPREPRRLSRHWIDGRLCPGSGLVVDPEGRPVDPPAATAIVPEDEV